MGEREEANGPWGDGFNETLFSDFTGFAGGVWDTENNGDHFGAREYHKIHGSWLSPDPAGLAAVDMTNPQTWNRYAYVMNNPVSFVDPLGLYLMDCAWYCVMGGANVVDGQLQTVYSSSGLGSQAATQCPNNDCSVFTRTYSGNSGGNFSLLAGVNGLTWINNNNGDELTSSAASEVGLGDPQSGLPSNLFPGTPQEYWGPFLQGFNAALKDLKRKKCARFYGGQGSARMSATMYRIFDLGNSGVGARTEDPTSVFINSNGPYMNYSPTVGQAGPFGLYWTQPQFQAFILLHELGHQLSPITGFQPDASPPGGPANPLNRAQSMKVIGACF